MQRLTQQNPGARKALRRHARAGLLRPLAGLVLFVVLALGTLATARPGASCTRAAVPTMQAAAGTSDGHAPAPDAVASVTVPHDHEHHPIGAGLAVPAPGCTAATALVEPAPTDALLLDRHAAPHARLATLDGAHDPPPLRRPPRLA